MRITSHDGAIAFVPWRPAMGRVFRTRFAFCAACTQPDPSRPWLAPTLVVAAACDGRRGILVARGDLGAFFAAHEGIRLVVDDVAAQLEAIAVAAPGLDIYGRVDTRLVECAGLLRRLLRLATAGHADPVPDAPVAGGRAWGRWLNRPLREVAPADLRALADEAVALRRRHRRLRARVRRFMDGVAPAAWGYVSPAWLEEQVRRWGPLTIQIQVRAAIVLRAISAHGLHLDPDRRAGLLAGLDAVVAEQRAILRSHGFLAGQPSSAAALRSILRRIERRHGAMPRTSTRDYATSEDALAPLARSEPFVKAWLAHNSAAQLRDLLARLGRRVVHPSFDVLKVTGRTSSYGEINAQAIPRDNRVRSCFAARPGHALVVADFRAIEMATLAQACTSQFGLDSRLATALNAARDPHVMVAALATGKPEPEVTEEERGRAKPINFGLPGGMGPTALVDYARASYAVELGDDQVWALTDAWFAAFPEMREFLREDSSPGEDVAIVLDLTPSAYARHTGRRALLDRPGMSDSADKPDPFLGGMLLKALGWPAPCTRAGRPYDARELDFLWGRARDLIDVLPADLGAAIAGRVPSLRLRSAVMARLDARSVMTLTGRARAGASYTERHNTVFQGLAADGAKLALWEVWRAGYKIVNFIHDELLVEVPAGPDTAWHAGEIGRLMIAGMRRVVPDVEVAVECHVGPSWGESGRSRVDGMGIATLATDRDAGRPRGGRSRTRADSDEVAMTPADEARAKHIGTTGNRARRPSSPPVEPSPAGTARREQPWRG